MKSVKHWFWIVYLMVVWQSGFAQPGQITVNRIELMPNEPSPYILRDWKQVAQKYDSMVYDINRTGEHFPMVFVRDEGTNYPGRGSFGLDSYVGTFSDNNGEAINVLSSLVGASLAGIDKTNQYNRNWILMSQDYFNSLNGEDLYLNNIGGHSGNDWWYDMMPNVYFYQLYDLYGPVGDAEHQFTTIAGRMAAAVRAMGGKATPWTRANMNYRAWDFIHMQPNPNGVHEPEAAGAFAWLLYHAYRQTHDIAYLQAAEWSMEFLVNLGSNPSYELQLPYGAYAAARMNAEIGTEYNMEKLLFWIFNRGPLRGWGTIVGNWNNFDVSGLVGEANDAGDDYAFQLNGVQQAAALTPMVRYDKRFARAIGKWMLQVSNATRLMYPGFLPSQLQDAHTWSSVYDPDGVMGYEALREVWNGMGPVSTGDALKGGWAATNLSLYSTSSIGYLGAIAEPTDVDKILKLDLLATDFFHDDAYPSYLLYNPYTEDKTVTLDVGPASTDVYDVLSESFLATSVSGEVQIPVPANEAVSIVFAPADGEVTYENNKMLINGVIVDFAQTQQAYNYPPRIQAFATESSTVEQNAAITLYAKGLDQETKDLTYTFILPGDTISSLDKTATWTTPHAVGEYELTLIVTDEAFQTDTATLLIEVVQEINIAPVIHSLTASSRYTAPGGSVILTADASDANGDVTTYNWSSTTGSISGSGQQVTFDAPSTEGISTIQLSVTDGRGGEAVASIRILVIDHTHHVAGDIIAWYPFEGHAQDISGNGLHGIVSGAKLTTDSLGQSQAAYFFDGVNDHIHVDNQPVLNFDEGITMMAFVTPGTIGDKERFIISHGSWQNRWKVSITPEMKLRWTIKNTSGGVRDLDSETTLQEDRLYHITCTYDGRFMIIYINGRPESFSAFTGAMNSSPVDMVIGQILPDDPAYNFNGVLDEIKIFDFALLPDSVWTESGQMVTGIANGYDAVGPAFSIFPNPSNGMITVSIPDAGILHDLADGTYRIYNTLGRICLQGPLPGTPSQHIDVSSLPHGTYVLTLHSAKKQMSTMITIL